MTIQAEYNAAVDAVLAAKAACEALAPKTRIEARDALRLTRLRHARAELKKVERRFQKALGPYTQQLAEKNSWIAA